MLKAVRANKIYSCIDVHIFFFVPAGNVCLFVEFLCVLKNADLLCEGKGLFMTTFAKLLLPL